MPSKTSSKNPRRQINAVPDSHSHALRGFDKIEAYGIISRVFQSVLRDHIPAETYSRAEKQARAASQRVQKEMQKHQVPTAKSIVDVATVQGTFDFTKTK